MAKEEWPSECADLISGLVVPYLREVADGMIRAGTDAFVEVGATSGQATLYYSPMSLSSSRSRERTGGETSLSGHEEMLRRERLRFRSFVGFRCEDSHGRGLVASSKGIRRKGEDEVRYGSGITLDWIRSYTADAVAHDYD